MLIESKWLLYLSVFVVAAANDFVWAKYISRVQDKKPLASGFWASGTLLLGAFNIVSYTHDLWALIPAAIGGFVGTWWVVKYRE